MPERRLPGDIAVEETVGATLAALQAAENYRRWIVALARPHLEPPMLEIDTGQRSFTGLLAELGSVHTVEAVDDVPAYRHYSSAVLFNVLEHTEDDAALVRAVRQRLRHGGTIAVWVPAFDVLYSRFDALLGHHRRYRRGPLIELMTACGYDVTDARYVNAAGWVSWFVGARLLNRIPNSPQVISAFDRLVVPLERRLEDAVHPPFGQSLFVAARAS